MTEQSRAEFWPGNLEGKRPVVGEDFFRRIILKLLLNRHSFESVYWINLFLARISVAGFCEHGNELCFHKSWYFFLRAMLLSKDTGLHSQYVD